MTNFDLRLKIGRKKQILELKDKVLTIFAFIIQLVKTDIFLVYFELLNKLTSNNLDKTQIHSKERFIWNQNQLV